MIGRFVPFDVFGALDDVPKTMLVEKLVATLTASKMFFTHATLLEGPESKIFTQEDVEGCIDGFCDVVSYKSYGVEAFKDHADLRC